LKRIDLLIKAVSQMDDCLRKKIHVRIIGMGPQEGVLKKMAEKYALSEIIEFVPPKPIEQIRFEIRESDICVVTSNAREGWGVAVNEILAEGRCLIASDASGAGKTLVKHGVNGLLFKSGSSRDLKFKLQSVIEDESLREQLANEGRVSLCREWIPEIAAERLIKFSQACMHGKKVPIWESGPLSGV